MGRRCGGATGGSVGLAGAACVDEVLGVMADGGTWAGEAEASEVTEAGGCGVRAMGVWRGIGVDRRAG